MKKIICLLVCVLMLVPIVANISFATPSFPFTDVKKSDWAYNSIEKMYQKGYMSGISQNTFGRKEVVTRAMIVTVLAQIADAKLGSASVTEFPDVAVDKWYTAQINWAHQKGIISGKTDGTFDPYGKLTREQAAVILRSFGKFMGWDVSYCEGSQLLLYYDEWRTSSYARHALEWAVDYSIFTGSGGYINPKDALTREQLASLLSTFIDYPTLKHIAVPDICLVKFVNYDGTLIQQNYVKKGGYANYLQTAPIRPDDEDYTYKFKGWNKSQDNILVDTTFTAQYSKTELPKRRIDPNKPMIAITFDDGPGAGSTSILNTLEKYGVVATFFDIGYNIVKYPDIIKREVALGCEIGNHTYNHPSLSNSSVATIRSEINQNYNAYYNILGFGPTLCRPPYGAVNATVRSTLADMNYKIIYWSIDTVDWQSRNANSVYNIAVGEAYDGAIILMHSLYPSTASAVERIVPALINKGYQLVTVSELAKYKGYSFKADGTVYYNFK